MSESSEKRSSADAAIDADARGERYCCRCEGGCAQLVTAQAPSLSKGGEGAVIWLLLRLLLLGCGGG